MKTAGTSIEVFLSQHCGEDDIVTPISPHVEPHLARNYRGTWNPWLEILHTRGWKARATLSQRKKKMKFYNHIPAMFVRERIPQDIWDNYFKFCVERNPWDKTLSHYHMINNRSGGALDFDQYFKKGKFCLNYPFYCDRKGEPLVDKIIRYEDLNTELEKLFSQWGIPFDGSLGVYAKSEHRKDRRPYQQVFTEQQRKIIEKAFSKEIEMLGYEY